MRCPDCSSEVSSNSGYCPVCGHVFEPKSTPDTLSPTNQEAETKGFSESIDEIRERSVQRRRTVKRLIVLTVIVVAIITLFIHMSGTGPESQALEQSQSSDTAETVNDNSGTFWGVWIGAFREEENAYTRATEARDLGFDAHVYISSDWTGLNQDMYYVVTAGCFEDEGSAQAALYQAVDAGFSDAYIKHTGDKKV